MKLILAFLTFGLVQIAEAKVTHMLVIKAEANREECLRKIQEIKVQVEETHLDQKIVFVDVLSQLEKLDCVQSVQENKPVYLE